MADFDLKSAADRLAARQAAENAAWSAKQKKDNELAIKVVAAVNEHALRLGKNLDTITHNGGEARIVKGDEQMIVTVNDDGTFSVRHLSRNPLKQALSVARAFDFSALTKDKLEEELAAWIAKI